MPVLIAAGEWGPCATCGTRIHRYGPGSRVRCGKCDDTRTRRDYCYQCGRPGEFVRYVNGPLCSDCAPAPQHRVAVAMSAVRGHPYADKASRARAYERRHIRLVLLHDLINLHRGNKRPAQELAQPSMSTRASARGCSVCRKPTIFATPRGRSVHPCCEGWLDTLADDALTDLTWLIGDILPIASQTDVT